MRVPGRLLLLLLAGLAFGPDVASADLLVPRSGKPLRGAVVQETDEEVVFNPYWSRHPDMVWEVVRLPRARVKRVTVAPHPEVEVYRRLAAADRSDAGALLEIGLYAKEHKLKAQARMVLALALAADPDSTDALKALGGRAKWNAIRKGNLHLDPELQRALRTYVRTEEVPERVAQAAALKKQGLGLRPEALERHRRSFGQPKGLMVDRPLSWHADRFPGAVYTFFVPPAYDPLRSWPLLVGLHGGGADGKRRDEMVGSGASAMNFYRDLAAKHGYLVACPTALHAGWGAEDNEELVRAVIEEVKHFYNVDVDRIHLTGHSMGGFGTWALGPRLADIFAAISPMAGGGRGGIARLVKTKTPIFIYHSDDDYVSVESDRSAAKQLRDTELDFVYTELPGKGHSLPDSIRRELFAFLEPRRLFDPKHKEAWPRSSFVGKVSKEERTYVGDPLDELEGRRAGLKDWLAWLELGGGRAATAVQHLGRAKPEGAAAAVAKVLKNARLHADVRAWSAQALGRLGDVGQAKALRRVVAEEAVREASRLAGEAARALAELADPEGGRAVARGVEAWTAYYEDKVVGGKLAFSDWQRSVGTLAVLVEAWGRLPGDAAAATALERSVVAKVLAPGHGVETSKRVPQDPSRVRVALARAVAGAYAAWGAPAERLARLREALASDPKALAAVADR